MRDAFWVLVSELIVLAAIVTHVVCSIVLVRTAAGRSPCVGGRHILIQRAAIALLLLCVRLIGLLAYRLQFSLLSANGALITTVITTKI